MSTIVYIRGLKVKVFILLSFFNISLRSVKCVVVLTLFLFRIILRRMTSELFWIPPPATSRTEL